MAPLNHSFAPSRMMNILHIDRDYPQANEHAAMVTCRPCRESAGCGRCYSIAASGIRVSACDRNACAGPDPVCAAGDELQRIFTASHPAGAFTPIALPTTRRINAMSPVVAPPLENPVEVFTKSAPARFASMHALIFSSSVNNPVSRITLVRTWNRFGSAHDGEYIAFDIFVIAGLQPSHVDHHVDFVCPVTNGTLRFKCFGFR